VAEPVRKRVRIPRKAVAVFRCQRRTYAIGSHPEKAYAGGVHPGRSVGILAGLRRGAARGVTSASLGGAECTHLFYLLLLMSHLLLCHLLLSPLHLLPFPFRLLPLPFPLRLVALPFRPPPFPFRLYLLFPSLPLPRCCGVWSAESGFDAGIQPGRARPVPRKLRP